MKLGEKLKYKARRYLYQLEQEANFNSNKIKRDIEENSKIHQKENEKVKSSNYNNISGNNNNIKEKYEGYNEYQYEKYDIYSNSYPKYEFYKEDSLKYNAESPKSYTPEKKGKEKITDTIEDMEEYLMQKFSKLKK